MKLWKPAVCLLLSGLLLSACAAPAGGPARGAPEPKTKGNCESSCLLFWYGWRDSNPRPFGS